jgi:hypothetical protein
VTANKKPDGMPEVCVVIFRLHVQKAGQQGRDKSSQQDKAERINTDKVV